MRWREGVVEVEEGVVEVEEGVVEVEGGRSGRLTGDLLDVVEDHEGVRQTHLHRVVHRADLRHVHRDLGERRTSAHTW